MTGLQPPLSVVSPVYGCRSCLPALVEGIEQSAREIGVDVEIILVDDGSPDGAWESIRDLAATHPAVGGVRLSRNFGQHAAISAGIARARGDRVVVMDCDMQDPPSAIPLLYRTAVDHNYDVVFAQRQNRQDTAPKRFMSWSFYRVLSWLTGVPQDGSTANFGIFGRKVIDAVVAMPERERAFPLMVKWVGFRTGYVPVEHASRAAGESTYTLRKMLKLALSIILGYSSKPLRMVATGGVICAGVSLLMAAVTIYLFMTGEIQVAGFTSVIASIWLLGGLTLFSLGVVGLYVGQVFSNAQGRPTSIVSEVAGHVDPAQESARVSDVRGSDPHHAAPEPTEVVINGDS